MKFRLLFEGEIPPRQKEDLPIIHDIRRSLHPQLKQLWEHEPLADLKNGWLAPVGTHDKPYARIENIGGKNFAHVIGQHMGAVLQIVLLRQQARGQLIGEGGDIDNRLKTLFDALRLPSKAEVQQLGTKVGDEEAKAIPPCSRRGRLRGRRRTAYDVLNINPPRRTSGFRSAAPARPVRAPPRWSKSACDYKARSKSR